MHKFQILTGSVMGTAQGTAEALADHLLALGHIAEVNSDAKATDLTRDEQEILLICTSNTGMGDLPANIAPLNAQLRSEHPRIAGRKYGLITLGDSCYPNFAQAGHTLDEAMLDLGAERIGETLILDACCIDDYHQEAIRWINDWLQQL